MNVFRPLKPGTRGQQLRALGFMSHSLPPPPQQLVGHWMKQDVWSRRVLLELMIATVWHQFSFQRKFRFCTIQSSWSYDDVSGESCKGVGMPLRDTFRDVAPPQSSHTCVTWSNCCHSLFKHYLLFPVSSLLSGGIFIIVLADLLQTLMPSADTAELPCLDLYFLLPWNEVSTLLFKS